MSTVIDYGYAENSHKVHNILSVDLHIDYNAVRKVAPHPGDFHRTNHDLKIVYNYKSQTSRSL